MTEQGQELIWLKTRKEYHGINEECIGLREAILQQATRYKDMANTLQTSMDRTVFDRGVLVTDVECLCDHLQRYQNLLTEKADRKARLEAFGERFKPLES